MEGWVAQRPEFAAGDDVGQSDGSDAQLGPEAQARENARWQLARTVLGQGERYSKPPIPVSSDEMAAFRDSLLSTSVQGRNAAIEQECTNHRRAD